MTTAHAPGLVGTAAPGAVDAPRALPPGRRRVGAALVLATGAALAALRLDWTWVPGYALQYLQGLAVTLLTFCVASVLGLGLAVALAVAQLRGPWPVPWICTVYSSVIRGTPLLLQIWFFYFGIGSVLSRYPALRETVLWPVLRSPWPYGIFALTVSFSGYAGEVMRGGFANVPRGELEAARSFGMSPWTLLWRVWFPRAFFRVLPALTGEMILLLKSTPLLATITIIDVFAVSSIVRRQTFLTYEPLLLLAFVYFVLSSVLIKVFKRLELRVRDWAG